VVLMTPSERAAMGDHRQVNFVLGWMQRDIVGLVDRGHVGAMRLGDLLACVAKLRTAYSDSRLCV
jgi:hypothetical protein